MKVKRICVFCGGLSGSSDRYTLKAKEFGELLAANQIGLVYGGGNTGLMGAVANAVMNSGGEAVGVIPKRLVDREISHDGLTELRIVDTMHERKAMMADLSDAFVAMPGGFGTLEELFEAITLTIIEAHSKPCAIYNVDGYYDELIQFLDCVKDRGFITSEDRDYLVIEREPDKLLQELNKFKPYKSTRWNIMQKSK